MSKTITIPSDRGSRVSVTLNGQTYTYAAGATVSVPNEVAALFESNDQQSVAYGRRAVAPLEAPAQLEDDEDVVPVRTDDLGNLYVPDAGDAAAAAAAAETAASEATKAATQAATAAAAAAAAAQALTVDAAMSDSSTNPVQNKVIGGTLKAATQATASYHLGFYLDANGDLCQVDNE